MKDRLFIFPLHSIRNFICTAARVHALSFCAFGSLWVPHFLSPFFPPLDLSLLRVRALSHIRSSFPPFDRASEKSTFFFFFPSSQNIYFDNTVLLMIATARAMEEGKEEEEQLFRLNFPPIFPYLPYCFGPEYITISLFSLNACMV